MKVCPSCGAENRREARFCDSCAAPLAEQPPPRELLKTVTVLFCDVTGSTKLGEQIDPESLRRVMARYFEVAKEVVERHGGTVEKFIGDAVMAVFGIPAAHEDDALRAARAAVELRGALVPLNAELAEAYGTRLELRTGLNTGEVVTGTEERLATGDAVNVAARLEQQASPGEILIGERTLRLIRDFVEVEPVEPLTLKGKSEPVAAHRLVDVAGVRPAGARTRSPWWAADGSGSSLTTRSPMSPENGRATCSPCSERPASGSLAWRRSSWPAWTGRSSRGAASPTARGSATGRSRRW